MRLRIVGLLLYASFLVLMLPGLLVLPVAIVLRGGTPFARRLLRSMDNFVNVLWCQGSPYETVSSHAYRHRYGHMRGWFRFLEHVAPGHAFLAYEDEQEIVRAARVEDETR